MKKAFFIFYAITFLSSIQAQEIPHLPIALGAGSAEVYNNNIYFIGGSNNWAGNFQYDSIFVYDGESWSLESTIPDKNLWDVETILVGSEIYLISGWPSGANSLRKYNIITKDWTYLTNSPNTTSWGVAAEYWNGFIYLFMPNGNVHEYSIQNNEWDTKTTGPFSGPLNLSSIIYNDEIYIIGYNDSSFAKYNPATDFWTPLAKSSYQVGASAMGIINDKIYNVGGNLNGSSAANYKNVLVYNITDNEWALDSLEISSKRHWMATAEYLGGLYVLGGIDSTTVSVNIVEEIVPQGTAVAIEESIINQPQSLRLLQNFPNPFNPTTIISYEIPETSVITIEVFNMLGQKVQTLVNKQQQQAGNYNVAFNGSGLVSGVYFYKLSIVSETNTFINEKTRKMILLK